MNKDVRLFLDEIYDRRIKVLSFINNHPQEVNITEIAEATGLAKRTVSMFIKQFDQELFDDESMFNVEYINGTIKSVAADNLDLNSIGSKYLMQSTIYKIVKAIFLNDKIDVKRFCDTEFISTATFSRYRKKLVMILNQSGLSLSRENKIIGDELRIRNFYFLFFSNASNSWMFSQQEYKEISEYFVTHLASWKKMNALQHLRISLIIYISLVRSRQKNFFDNKTLINLTKKRTQEPSTKFFYEYFASKRTKIVNQIWAETSSTLFFLYKERILYESLELDNYDYVSLENYEHYFSKENFPFIQSSKQLACEILNEFFDGMTSQSIYLRIRMEVDLFHFVVNTSFVDPSIFYYIYDEKNFFYSNKQEIEIKEKINKMFQRLRKTNYDNCYKQFPTYITQSALNDYLYLIIYTLIIQFKSVEYSPVKIFIQNTKLFVTDLLINKINLIFGDRVECVEELSSSVDIIVTDTNISDIESDAEQIFVATFSASSDISFLVEKIQYKLIEKYGQKNMNLIVDTKKQ